MKQSAPGLQNLGPKAAPFYYSILMTTYEIHGWICTINMTKLRCLKISN